MKTHEKFAVGMIATLFAVTPASAIYRDYEPGDADEPVIRRTANTDDGGAKKGCTVNMQKPDGSPGQSIVYPHGYSFSVQNQQTGKTHTYTCNDGNWEETVNFTNYSDEYVYEADEAYVDATGDLWLDNPHEYTTSTDDVYYVQP